MLCWIDWAAVGDPKIGVQRLVGWLGVADIARVFTGVATVGHFLSRMFFCCSMIMTG